MKQILIIIGLLFLFPIQENFSKKASAANKPEVPRVSARKAYMLFKTGKTILVHSGGAKFSRRHLLGAIEVDHTQVKEGRKKIPRLPKKGKVILIYCY